MSELELALTRIGRELDYPDTPELVGPSHGDDRS
jgi:hypothetical protein